VRRLARELGVNIDEVPGTGPSGRITDEDVRAYVRKRLQELPPAAPSGVPAPAALPLPDFSKWGEIERRPMSSVRRKTARHLAHAWSTVPHVTHHDKADITELEQLRKKYEAKAEAAGGKLAMTAIAVRVVASALKVFPQFAASVDMAREEIVYKQYTHIGVAVDTDRGLLVPVIRNADQKNILQLSIELAQIAERTRNRKITLEEMEGSVFTISNLGGIGGTAFSPIVNSPEVAILGISRGRMEPVFISGLFQPRLMLPLSLSYDHRVIDGADAARFLRWVVEALEQPFLLPFEG
jgi:pyruvate dehydrogenase E2 component (dihydrolipoamide acetyltransferase)